ncbi:MAG: serine protease inhibitor, partial [bacterium]
MNINEGFHSLTPQFVEANNSFAFDLFKEIYSSNKEKNIFISPISLAINLAMISQGSLGANQKEILKTLALDGLNQKEINSQYQTLLNSLSYSNNKILLSIANCLCIADSLNFNSHFLEQVKTFYQATIHKLNFISPKSIEIINNWVLAQTNGKISEIVDKLDPSTLLIALNAIYFKGEWTNKFNPSKTKAEAFYLANGRTKLCPMMFSDEEVESFFTKNLSAISLPYGDGRLSLCLFLPSKTVGLDGFLGDLTLEKWQEYFNQPWPKQTLVAIPRFKLEFKVDLVNHLSKLGIKEAFSFNANFQAMINTDRKLSLDQVLQKTFLEVN